MFLEKQCLTKYAVFSLRELRSLVSNLCMLLHKHFTALSPHLWSNPIANQTKWETFKLIAQHITQHKTKPHKNPDRRYRWCCRHFVGIKGTTELGSRIGLRQSPEPFGPVRFDWPCRDPCPEQSEAIHMYGSWGEALFDKDSRRPSWFFAPYSKLLCLLCH